MPATRALGKIPAVDLAYAVDRLIQEGKTSLAEVRKRQGQYLAALKRLKGVERARVKTVARKEGVAKAIELARKLAKAVPAKAA